MAKLYRLLVKLSASILRSQDETTTKSEVRCRFLRYFLLQLGGWWCKGAPTCDGASPSPLPSGSIYWAPYLTLWHRLKSCTILSAPLHFLRNISLASFPPEHIFFIAFSPDVFVPFFPFLPPYPYVMLSESLKFSAVPTSKQPLQGRIIWIDFSETSVCFLQITRRYIPQHTTLHAPQCKYQWICVWYKVNFNIPLRYYINCLKFVYQTQHKTYLMVENNTHIAPKYLLDFNLVLLRACFRCKIGPKQFKKNLKHTLRVPRIARLVTFAPCCYTLWERPQRFFAHASGFSSSSFVDNWEIKVLSLRNCGRKSIVWELVIPTAIP